MKASLSAVLLILLAGVDSRPEQALAYFSNVRDVRVSQPDRQNYFVVDEDIWMHSRPDLADLRLFDGDTPVQYAIAEQGATVSSEEVEAKILNLGTVAGHTEFDIDAEAIAEYDRVRLRLAAHDFVAVAQVRGGAGPGTQAQTQLPPTTLYDFTKEQLGSNFQLKLPTSSFRYLHVILAPGIRPEEVKGVTISNLREQQARWTSAGSCGAPQQKDRITEIVCKVAERVPLNRIAFQVSSKQTNFRRTVSIADSKGAQIATGEISRVRVNRGGALVNTEELAVNLSSSSGSVTVSIDNADNPPLEISAVEPLATERRIYFDPQAKSAFKLYYGDEKLEAPVYDYARFFHADPSASQAELAPGAHNPQYSGRPDDRPWSEKHSAILWTAMLAAVIALLALAIRGLRRPA